MKQKVFKEKYHIFEIEYKKSELQYKSVDEIISALQVKIDAHPVIAFIAIFDQYKHTSSLKDGEINPNIKAAKVQSGNLGKLKSGFSLIKDFMNKISSNKKIKFESIAYKLLNSSKTLATLSRDS